jgi:uncharacterized membrane protein YeaQ/YmgE (transglycosylase-associated protein family)
MDKRRALTELTNASSFVQFWPLLDEFQRIGERHPVKNKIRGVCNFEQSNNDRKTSVSANRESTLSSGHGLWRLGMFYSIWLLAAALTGWCAGKITGRHRFGSGTDILLGVTGAFMVRWFFENVGVSLDITYLLLFSIWGAAALPAALRFGIRLHNRSRNRSRLQSD